ncbi:hypothetical protein [Escherichia coli]|uniref:hypothetical protein n=1 Tax=Escherichia coli TaxID=562 RepID=UPI000773BBF6|nr:hypothetical protein [Escherichia coli]APJ80156.1 hypothetical protein RG28_28430 [Escherichia coli]EEU0138320.1 hypothetical protein [Escherichia coli]EEV5626104.1 hypothetical protein [Escherichia coli]EEV6025453.1 hypothetical protein [Escherichia coli]EEZ3919818.1 hypothetical protein [Escherichia coli]
MEYDDVSELMIKCENNILIVGNSYSRIDVFFKGYSIQNSKYYDFTQINSDSDTERNEHAVSFIRDAMNSEEHTIIFNCVGWSDLGTKSAVSQFVMMARKFGKQLIVAVSEKDAIKLKDNFNIIGTLSYGKENFIAMSHTKSELTGGKRRYQIKNRCK